jgi:hypothetical protein
MLTKSQIKEGSTWIGNSGSRFRVQRVCTDQDEDGGQEYSCLVEAFEHRFSLYSNQKD